MGGYINSYQFQILRLLPFMSRLGDLLQRESQMTNSQDRQQAQLLANEIGKALNEIVLATIPVVNLFRNVIIGEHPGEFRLPIPNINLHQQLHQQQHQGHIHQHQNQQQQQQGGSNTTNLTTSNSLFA